MISISSIVFMIVTLVVGLILPTAFCLALCAKKKLRFLALFMGMVAAELGQVIIATGVLNPLYNLLTLVFDSEKLVTSAIIGALTVAVLYECSRLIFARFTLDRKLNIPFKDALAFGLGYGIMGNIASMGTIAIGNITLALSINKGTGVFADYSASVGKEAANQVLNTLLSVPPLQFAAGGLQCLMMIAIEICFSVLMIYSLVNHKKLGVLAVVAMHFVLNFGITLMSPHGVWAGELYIAIFMVALGAISFETIRKYFLQTHSTQYAAECAEETDEEPSAEAKEEEIPPRD